MFATPGLRTASSDQAGVVTQKVFGCRVSKNPGDEIFRDLAMAAAQDFARRGDQRRFGTLFIGAGKVGSYHRVFPRHARYEPAEFLRFKSILPQVFLISSASLSHRSCGVER
jgi:hypothetical protein